MFSVGFEENSKIVQVTINALFRRTCIILLLIIEL